MTTLGRVLRATSSNLRDAVSQEERLSQAAAALEEAARIGNELHDGELEGRALSQLARIEQDHGSVDTAIELAQDALVLLHRTEDVMEVQLLLGGLFRDAGMDDRAGAALDIAANLAARSGKADYALARVLNIQASADRRAGRTAAAIGRARRSLEIGELLEDRRHTAHAMHTLAAALADRGQTEDRSEAGRLLAGASRILVALGDQRGADMVAKTASRLSRL